MYAHESTCTRCGNDFIVEVKPGDAMQRRGICNGCKFRQGLKFAAIAAPIFIVTVVIVAVCG